jgi:hypothetical protein
MMLKGPDEESVFGGHGIRMLSPGANKYGFSILIRLQYIHNF